MPKINNFVTSREWFITNWLETDKSLITLAKEFNVSDGMLEYRAKKYGLAKKYKYTLNENKVNLDDPVIQYFLGLMYSDGWLHNKAKTVCISLSHDFSRDLLLKLKDYFEYTGPLAEYKTYNSDVIKYTLSIGNIALYDLCKSVGLTKSKTSTIRLPLLPEYRHFLRGFIDGDGCIHKNKKVINWYCDSIKFNEDIKIAFPTCTVSNHHICKGTVVTWYGDKAKAIAEYIYTDRYYCLQTKLEKAKLLFNI